MPIKKNEAVACENKKVEYKNYLADSKPKALVGDNSKDFTSIRTAAIANDESCANA